MNKFVKLPLFLGVVGGICTALLATTYIVTIDAITTRENNLKLEGYFKAFGLDINSGANADKKTVSDELISKGITVKVVVSKDGSDLGTVYDGKVDGRNGSISFQVSFADGKYNSFTVVGGHSENKGYAGADILDVLGTKLNGIEATKFTDAAEFYNNSDFISGGTAVSTKNLFPAIVAAAADYAASL